MTTLKIACASLLLLSGGMAASCSSDTETEAADRVEVSGLDDTVRFTYDAAESVAFTVASNKTWSIAKNGLDWLTVSQMNGGSKLPATVRLTAEANDDLERSGHLTIYAGALAQTVTVTQEACPVVPTITLGGLADNTIAFEFTDTEPVTFKLYANVDWTADKQNLGWAEVAPLSGARKQEATITVTPTANPGDAREGFVTFRAEGMEPVVVTVRQAAYRDEPMLVVTGADENRLAFANTPEAPTALHILCNRGWAITKTDLDWLTVSPAAGTASAEPAEVTLTAEPNDGAARSGTLTVRADDPALADVVITVSQAAKGNPLLAWWTLDAIAKGMTYRKEHHQHRWDCPYIPIDPHDISRTYDADVIRINSQSGKGGIGFLLQQNYGYNPPPHMREQLGYRVKEVSDHDHRELSVQEVLEVFEDNYVNNAAPLNVTAAHYTQNQDGSISANLTLRRGSRMIQCGAAGNGRLDAVANAIEQAAGMDFTLIHYSEHALDPDTDSRACSYVGLKWPDGRETWGCGTHTDIIVAGVRALVSAINNR